MDIDAILIAIRAAAGNQEMEINSKCPKCENESVYGLNLVNLLSSMAAADYTQELEVNDLKIKFRPLSYNEMNEANLAQFELQRVFGMLEQEQDLEVRTKKTNEVLKSITELTIRILCSAIEHIKTPGAVVTEKEFIADFLTNCDKDTYTSIRDYNAVLRAKTEIKPLDVKCTECSNEYKQPFTLNATDFFG
jgi:ribosomal protein S27E